MYWKISVLRRSKDPLAVFAFVSILIGLNRVRSNLIIRFQGPVKARAMEMMGEDLRVLSRNWLFMNLAEYLKNEYKWLSQQYCVIEHDNRNIKEVCAESQRLQNC